ncbi:hypothetical protein Q0590_05820 [Rhodocytophaga aerolata]|uniref:Cytochrome c n=1 Tax=Rhodocytophaga aerolata TaxID=455078 RepID=A0ABT8R0Y3_9BACT|nr:hypothetical protein [Rhodocytophaga aerolata]MDO1445757.1 hypothetical protein [Rhodocytophaga aerolata]
MWKFVILLAMLFTGLASFKDASQATELNPRTSARWVTDTLKVDEATGLIIDEHLPLIRANCTGCHSTKLIGQHRFTREGWVGKIRWMQQYHNLWNLGESEKLILDYLEKHYSPASASNKVPARRTPLTNIEWYKLDE